MNGNGKKKRCDRCDSYELTFGAVCYDENGESYGEIWFCGACRNFVPIGISLDPPSLGQQSSADDRRRQPRFNVNFVIEVLLDGTNHAEPILATSINASTGGVAFIYPEELPEGMEGHFRVSLPSVRRPFSAEGKVVRCEQTPDGSYGVGVRFTRVDDRYIDALERYIKVKAPGQTV